MAERESPFELRSEAALFVATFAFMVYAVIDGDAFPAALAGFLVGMNAVSATRSLYLVIWRSKHRNPTGEAK